MNSTELKIYEIIESNNASTTEQGDKIFSKLFPLMKYIQIEDVAPIELNFDNIDTATTAFLNNAVGKLFYTYDEDLLAKNLSFTNCNSLSIISAIQRSLTNARALSQIKNQNNSDCN